MAATVIINEWNTDGGSPSMQTDKTSGTVRFKNADNATVDLIDPLVVPTTGREYSYEKWLRLQITGGAFTQIDNLRAYSDGANNYGTGIKLWNTTHGVIIEPGNPDETLDPPQALANEPGGSPTVTMTDFFAATSGAPVDLDAINTGPFTANGHIGDFLVLVMEVETTASQGVLSAETLTFAYDEI